MSGNISVKISIIIYLPKQVDHHPADSTLLNSVVSLVSVDMLDVKCYVFKIRFDKKCRMQFSLILQENICSHLLLHSIKNVVLARVFISYAIVIGF